jgi:hypothetical protein
MHLYEYARHDFERFSLSHEHSAQFTFRFRFSGSVLLLSILGLDAKSPVNSSFLPV